MKSKARMYLERIPKLNEKINQDIARKSELMEMTVSVSRDSLQPHYDPNHAQHAPYEKCVEKAVELERQITEEIDSLVDLKDHVMTMIAEIPDSRCREILNLRYVHCMSWTEITVKMNLSERRIFQIHAAAMRAFEAKLDEKKIAVGFQ